MNARRGYTLVESLVACTLVGSLLWTIALALHGTYQSDRRIREETDLGAQVFRFAAQFREDAHQARAAKIETPDGADRPASRLSLAMPDQRTIEYALQPQGIERVVRRGETVIHREGYRLPASATARWQVEEGRRSPVVSLVLEPGAADSSRRPAAGAHRIDAAVNLIPTHPASPASPKP